VQRLQRGPGFAASYKPSVLANADRIIMVHALDASSETLMIAAVLDQGARVSGMQAEALPDAGYFDDVRSDACARCQPVVPARTVACRDPGRRTVPQRRL
jgi:hypothetical protein